MPTTTGRTATSAHLSIGQVAARTHVAASALRYYETEGLIPEPHRVGGKRLYGDDVISRVALIQVAQAAGFTLKEVRTLLSGIEGSKRGTKALQKLAEAKLEEVDASMKRLKLLRRLLAAATTCSCPTLEMCGAAATKAGLVAPPKASR